MNDDGKAAAAGPWPAVRIASDRAKAVVYLPDPARGYYRGPRFDWSGLVASLRLDGREVFGVWKTAAHDPLGNDFVVGPAGEFGMGPETGNPAPLGFEDAPPGGSFLKIGVGELRRSDEKPYHFGTAYRIVRPAPWRVRWGASWIQFRQEASLPPGLSYKYTKRIELPAGESVMRILYALENTGTRPIRQSWYCHNFIRIDRLPIGTGYALELPFAPRLARTFGNAVEVRGRSVAFVRDLGPDEGMFAVIEGYGATPADNEATVRCALAGASGATSVALSIRGSLPVARFHLFATGLTVCPELFVDLDLEPGRSVSWTNRYSLEPTASRSGPARSASVPG